MMNWKTTRCILFSAAATFVVWLVCDLAGIRFNHSRSLPQGIYALDEAGRYVMFCPAEPWAALSRLRGYRPSSIIGPHCDDGYEPMMKRIAAEDGDTVEMSEAGVRVNGALLPHSRPHFLDTAGKPVTPFPSGTYVMGQNEYWVMGDHAYSFDSRYYGPVSTDRVQATLRAVLTR